MIGKTLACAAVALAIGIIGFTALWAGEAWLVPSLGSAIFLQALSPRQETAKPWPTGVGQVVGAIGGFVSVLVTGAGAVPIFTDHHLAATRVWATIIAAAFTAAGQFALKALSPAGGATALVVALGTETTNIAGFARLMVGIALVTALGEIVRRAVLRASPPG